MKYQIDIKASDGTKCGDGPLLPTGWDHTQRLSRAGSISFTYPALNKRKDEVISHRTAHCRSVDQTRGVADFGSGIIQQITLGIQTSNKIEMKVTGGDLMRELQKKTVGQLVIDDGAGGETTTAPADIMAFAPSGWTLDTATGYNSTTKAILHTFDGETILAALVRLAELTGENFYNDGRKIVWMQTDQHAATVRAVQATGGISLNTNPDICIISSLTQNEDSSKSKIGRLYAIDKNDLNLSTTTKTPPSGWLIGNDARGYYLEHTATWNSYGIEAWEKMSDIDGVDPLYEAAYEYITLRMADYFSYTLSITGLQKPLHPGQLIAVEYRKFKEGYKAIDINEELLILENAVKVNALGNASNRLTIANIARWPDGSAEVFARNLK